jgi:hypothetical protein
MLSTVAADSAWLAPTIRHVLPHDPEWQMQHGERAALEGLLAFVKPRVAIEIGTARGGSLRRLAAHSEVVHSLDLVPPPAELAELPNVRFHTGDSHELLPRLLASLEAEGAQVDFALVDGDHTAEGARRDVEDLLVSDAVRRCLIVVHDTMNPGVRSGFVGVDYTSFGKVAFLDTEMVAGYAVANGPFAGQLWGGFGLIEVDAERVSAGRPPLAQRERHESFDALRTLVESQHDDLRGELDRAGRVMADLQSSLSWRITAPLRAAKRALR